MFNGPVFLNETIQANARAVNAGGISESLDEANALYSRLSGASFKLVPSSFGRGVLYSGAPGVNGDLTWTRGSDAFRTNASGLIQRVPWNLLSWSEDLTNASWIKTNVTITANTTTSPDGSTNADKIIATTTNDLHICESSTNSFVTGTTYTFSFYAKKSENDFIQFTASSSLLSTRANFNVSNGTLGTVDAGLTASITSANDGWYRCIVTFTASATGSFRIILCAITTSTAVRFQTFAGNGTSGLFLYGAQLVEGTTAQTYLPTTDRLNFPRLSYMYGSCPSVLLEPQRTNLVLRSEEFDNASWTKFNTSVTANTTTSPDGSSNADTMTGNGTTTQKGFFQSISITNGVTYTISIYAKKNTNNFLQIGGGDSFAITSYANFNLDTGALGTIGSTATATITNVGNGWYRCTMTASTIFGGSTSIAYRLINSSNSPSGESNTLSTSVYLFGAQLEAGAYPTTYIPTTSATATRVADSFSRNNIYTNGLISASGGTWFVELRNNISYVRDNTRSFGLSDNAFFTNNVLAIFPGSGDRRIIYKLIGGAFTQLYITTTDTTKLVIKWNGTTADIFANGIKVVSATSFTTTNLEFLSCESNLGTGTPVFIQQMALYPTPLSDTDCASLTADYTDGTSIVGDYERYVSQKSGAVENLNGVTNLIQNLK